ncbi:hypothetical protein SAMN05414137_10983 [Streptacidiphilus jiangxiensis]|uniref:Uncharacterized protein n=1 Tax=Streptacidiphilus jiangxiensis TaxID=235985 RepID=A0A1H7QKX0_STRJI|nr:hypothetical protein SAMN05414137_10983 [Streptacidiphilus jiangxiensis]
MSNRHAVPAPLTRYEVILVSRVLRCRLRGRNRRTAALA